MPFIQTSVFCKWNSHCCLYSSYCKVFGYQSLILDLVERVWPHDLGQQFSRGGARLWKMLTCSLTRLKLQSISSRKKRYWNMPENPANRKTCNQPSAAFSWKYQMFLSLILGLHLSLSLPWCCFKKLYPSLVADCCYHVLFFFMQ